MAMDSIVILTNSQMVLSQSSIVHPVLLAVFRDSPQSTRNFPLQLTVINLDQPLERPLSIILSHYKNHYQTEIVKQILTMIFSTINNS